MYRLKIIFIFIFITSKYVYINGQESTSPWVVVVGAGPSGIAAATRLYEGGITNITILEAQNRIGGRVFTTTFGDTVIDMGAQWCHGEENNVVYNLVKDLDVLGESLSHCFTMVGCLNLIDSSGQTIDAAITNQLEEVYYSLIRNSDSELASYNGSSGRLYTDKYYKMINQDKDLQKIDPKLVDQFLELIEKFENALDASDSWFDTSAFGEIEYYKCPGNLHLNWKNRGYKTVLDVLMKKYPDTSKTLPIDDKFLLNKEVVNINWENLDKIKISTSDDSLYEPDYVIFTSSLGVLKERYESLFTPQLPPFKVNAITGLEFGTLGKIFFYYEEPWWPENWFGFTLLWTENDKAEYQGNKSWVTGIYGFYRVDYKPHILSAWLSGAAARQMETLTPEEVEDECVKLLKRFLVNKSFNITKPTSITKTSWFSNPYFRGTYSYRSVNSERQGAFAAHLAEPITTPDKLQGLLFAGEATNSHYYSTVHGAVASGWREADRIMNFKK